MKTRVGAPLLLILLAFVGCSEDAPSDDISGTLIYDSECDGTPETCALVEYDAHGRELYSAEDNDCDGQPDPDTTCSKSYTEDGHLTQSQEDAGCDGVVDHCYAEQPDGDGNWLVGDDSDCDGRPDPDCLLRSGSLGFPVQYDAGCDGVPESCSIVTKHPDGSVERLDDSDCDGTRGPCSDSETYDAEGRQIFFSLDLGCKGIAKWCISTTYGDAGYVLEEVDTDCDGAPESCTETALDESGAKFLIRSDDDCDGMPESCSVEQRGPKGETISRGDDSDCNGEADANCQTAVILGKTEQWQFDTDCNGTPEKCNVNTYDNGILTNDGSDDDCDGTADGRCSWFSKD